MKNGKSDKRNRKSDWYQCQDNLMSDRGGFAYGQSMPIMCLL